MLTDKADRPQRGYSVYLQFHRTLCVVRNVASRADNSNLCKVSGSEVTVKWCVKWLAKGSCCNEGTPPTCTQHYLLRVESPTFVCKWPAQSPTHPPLVRDDGQLVAISLVSDRKLWAFDQPPNNPYGRFFNVETETHEREHAAHLYERQSIKLP